MKFNIYLLLLLLSSCNSLNMGNHVESKENNLNHNSELSLKNQYDLEISQYQKNITQVSNDISLSLKYAKLLRSAGYFHEAISFLENNSYREDIDFLEEIALNYLNLAELDRSLEYFHKVMDIDSARWKAIANIGLIYGLKENFEEARKYFTIALEINENNYIILSNYAQIEVLANNISFAKTLLTKALNCKNIPDFHRVRIEQNLENL